MNRSRTDIFRAMPEGMPENGYQDVSSRKMLFPTRIVWTQGNVENSEVLLQKRAMQISLNESELCIMRNTKSEKASILLITGLWCGNSWRNASFSMEGQYRKRC